LVTGLPDYWHGRRLPEPTLGPLHVKFAATAKGIILGKSTGGIDFGTPPAGEVWQIHNVKATIDRSSLIRVMLFWMELIIQAAHGYGTAELNIPKGLDYRQYNYLIVQVHNYNTLQVEARINVNGIVMKI